LNKNRVKQEVYKYCIGSNKKIVKQFKYVAKTDLMYGLKKVIEYQKNA
jgi:hypothetical protein